MARESTSFESGVTAQALALAALPVLVSLFLIWTGIYYALRFPGSNHLVWLLVCGLLPLLFGCAILVVMFLTMKKNMQRRVEISSEGLTYRHGAHAFVLKWSRTAYTTARPVKVYRVLVVSDGQNMVRLEDLFFPDFDEIVRNVAEMKGGRR